MMEERTLVFSFHDLRRQFDAVMDAGYRVITCREYIEHKLSARPEKVLVNRVDIDFSVDKADRVADLFGALDIKATFFIRLHAPEYNPFSFENYKILKRIRDDGHEIGYHSEVVDTAAAWSEEAAACLVRDLEILNRMLNVQIVGVASHGGLTGLNNLDFWKDRKPSEFGLLYEAYDQEPAFNLFAESFYVSDSDWTKWKCYDQGKRIEHDDRSLAEHVIDQHTSTP